MASVESPATKKLRELQEVEREIESLRFQLLEAERRRDIMQRELASYKVTRGVIQILPLELLCIVFSFVEEPQAIRNRKLALVCNAWRVVVIETPHLWTQLVVEWQGDLQSLIQTWNYVDVCRYRSGNLPLDVTIDLGRLPSLAGYIMQILNNHFDPLDLEPYSAPPVWVQFEEHEIDTFEHAEYDALLVTTMQKVIGERTDLPPQLRSLRIVVPAHLSQANAHLLFQKVLEGSSQIAEFEYRIMHSGNIMTFYDPVIVELPPFPALKKLKTVEDIRFPHGSPVCSNLEYLELRNGNAVFSFLSIAGSSFSALRFLSLTVWSQDWLPDLANMVFLPSLHTLKVTSDAHWNFMALLNASHLHTVDLAGAELSTYPALLTMSSLKALLFDVKFFTELPLTVEKFKALFKDVLIRSLNLEAITIRCHRAIYAVASKLANEAVKEVRASGVPLVLQKRVVVIGHNMLF